MKKANYKNRHNKPVNFTVLPIHCAKSKIKAAKLQQYGCKTQISMSRIATSAYEANKKSNLTPIKTESTSTHDTKGNRTMKVEVGPVKTTYKGNNPSKDMVSFLIPVGVFAAILGGGYIAYHFKRDKNKHAYKKDEQNNNSKNSVREAQQVIQMKMEEDDNKTDNEIRKARALSDIRIMEKKQMLQFYTATAKPCTPQKDVPPSNWIKGFHSKYPMPDYSGIPFLASILNCCPSGYEDAVMLSLLTECGALCFSKVRAPYVDGQKHSPSLQTIIEGGQGSGKGKLLGLHKCLFSKVIDSDNKKLNSKDSSDAIIQTAGIYVSLSKFHEVMANNHGVHVYAIESEISTVEETFKKSNGLSFDYLRKAFSNEPIYLNNKAKKTVRGTFPVFFNYTFTGTPKAIDSLIKDKEVEGGTASRICFSVIPEVDRFAPHMYFPSGGELQSMQNQIDEWREKYCYQTIDGKDVACEESIINIDYVCDALNDWTDAQYELYNIEGIIGRKENRPRIATIAFHCAIVLHMLAGEPKPTDRKLRKTVKELTVYIANYCMERYLFKFCNAPLPQPQSDNEMSVGTPIPISRRLSDEEISEWHPKHGTIDEEGRKIGYGYIAKKLNVTKDSVRNSFKKYEKTCMIK